MSVLNNYSEFEIESLDNNMLLAKYQATRSPVAFHLLCERNRKMIAAYVGYFYFKNKHTREFDFSLKELDAKDFSETLWLMALLPFQKACAEYTAGFNTAFKTFVSNIMFWHFAELKRRNAKSPTLVKESVLESRRREDSTNRKESGCMGRYATRTRECEEHDFRATYGVFNDDDGSDKDSAEDLYRSIVSYLGEDSGAGKAFNAMLDSHRDYRRDWTKSAADELGYSRQNLNKVKRTAVKKILKSDIAPDIREFFGHDKK